MADHPFMLHGKTVFITGSSSGIGRALAVECAKIGAKLVITGRNKERLAETYEMLDGDGHQQFVADLNNSDEIHALVEKLPVLDGFACNAGINKLLPVQFIQEDELNETFRINSVAPILLTRSLVKQKKFKNPSSVVFTSSIAGIYNASPANSMYAASKSALHGFMKHAALELAKKGIRSNSVNPGFVTTNLSDLSEYTQEQRRDHVKKFPLKRLGKPEDVAYAIIYLLSDASSWVTGTSLIIDGGYTIN